VFPDYSFQSHYLQLKGGRLHFIDEGSGPVIVMVHGNPTWSYYFRNVITLLSKSYRVIAIDHMGCGLSDKPREYSYTLAQHSDNLENLLIHLKITRYSLMVHDWGGAIGFGCAVRNPEAIEKIVVMNTAAFRSNRIPFRISLCRIPILGEILVRLFNGFAWPAQFMAVENKMEKNVAKAYLYPYNSWNNRVAVHRFVRDIPMNPRHKSYSTLMKTEQQLDVLYDLKVPVLILWGGCDFCFNKSFFVEWTRRFPDAEKHYFNDGGHYVLEDKFAEIAPILTEFFPD